MRAVIGIALVSLSFLGHASAQGGSAAPGSIKGDVFRKATHGELAVLPGVYIVLHEPITKGTESDAQGAFAIDSPPRGLIRSKRMLPACTRHWRSAPMHLPPVQSK